MNNDSGSGTYDVTGPSSGNTTKPSLTTAQIVSQLTTSWGYTTHIRDWQSSTVTYALLDTAPTNIKGYTDAGAQGVQALTASEKASAGLAFQLWADLIPLNLVQTTSAAANITFNYSSTTSGDGTYTVPATYSSTGSIPLTYNGTSYATGSGPSGVDKIAGQEVYISSDWSTNQSAAIKSESYGLVTYEHEIGHALGLSHPGTYNAGSGGTITYDSSAFFAQDNREYTIMSYFGGYNASTGSWAQDGTYSNWYYPSTPMVYDIAAIQALYGTNTTTRAGDTVYGFHSTVTGAEQSIYDFSLNTHPIYTIWDSGGTNTLDGSLSPANQIFDLRPGHYSSLDGMNSNIGIAFGTYVDVAIGGSGNDTFYVNGQNDTIDGRGGSNTVIFTGAHTGYSISQDSSGHIILVDQRLGGDATVTTSNIQNYRFADGTYTAAQLLGGTSTMKAVTFTAVESVTGDKVYGYAYDNANPYHVGSTFQTGADQLGGHWTYTVTGVATADSIHQDASFAGKVYDTAYYDADLGTSFTTATGYLGAISGSWAGYFASVGDSAGAQWWAPWEQGYASGTNGLGSDKDSITAYGATYSFGNVAGSERAVPELPVMKVVTFTAVESVTGDKIYGYAYDNTGAYHAGSTYTSGADQLGGHWNYTVSSVSVADSVHQDASLSGDVYDTWYYVAHLGTSATTVTGYLGAVCDYWAGYLSSVGDSAGAQWWLAWEKGYASGTSGLGSDGDHIDQNGSQQAFGHGFNVISSKPAAASSAPMSQNQEQPASANTAATVATHASGIADDTLTGGPDADKFVFAVKFGHDTIEHFTVGEDSIEFNHGDFADFSAVLEHATQVGSDVLISLDAQDTLLLKNVALASLHASDFHFV